MAIRSFDNITPEISMGVFVDETALVIGDVTIGDDSSIWPYTVIRGDVNQIRIGARTNIQDQSMVHATHKSHYNPEGATCTIGDDVTVGHQVILHACTIADNCLIGMGSIIMDNAQVNEYTLLGAGSLVTEGLVLDGGLWLGRPARRLRALTNEEKEYIKYSAQNYVCLAKQHQEK